jgi:hypothetical protein
MLNTWRNSRYPWLRSEIRIRYRIIWELQWGWMQLMITLKKRQKLNLQLAYRAYPNRKGPIFSVARETRELLRVVSLAAKLSVWVSQLQFYVASSTFINVNINNKTLLNIWNVNNFESHIPSYNARNAFSRENHACWVWRGFGSLSCFDQEHLIF